MRRDRVRSDEEDRPAVTAEHASERGEDRAVVGFEARTRDLALQHGELMAQHEDLDIFGTIRAAAQHQQVDHEPDKTVETGHAPILAAPEPHRSSPKPRSPRQTFAAPTRCTSIPVPGNPQGIVTDDHTAVDVRTDAHPTRRCCAGKTG